MTTATFLTFPAIDGDWLAFVDERSDEALARAQSAVSQLKDATSRDPESVVDLWNLVDAALRDGTDLTLTMSEVHPEKAVRSLAERRTLELKNYVNELRQDTDLFAVLTSAAGELSEREGSRDATGPESPASRLLRLTIRDFRRAGVTLDEGTRSQLRDLVERATTLSQDFGRVIREDVRTIQVAPERLRGLPEDFVADHPAGEDGLVTITTDYPDFLPFIQFCDDAVARRELAIAFLNRGWPENDAHLSELLATRYQHARLLGYENWADYAAEDKMLNTGRGVADFIARISSLARPNGERERDQLLERLRVDRPEATGIDNGDRPYYSEILRRELYDVDAQDVRRYFDFEKVRAGLLYVTGRLFGLRYEASTAGSWHEDVVTYDVYRDGDDALVGRIHLDLFPRDGKFKHAAQFDLVAGVNGTYGTASRRLPEGALVCNFSRGLMEHDDVVVLFHEFGHLVHHVLGGDQAFARFSGVATEWDFVEAPSQMLEEWAYDAEVLRDFAADETGQAIPVELVARLNAARDFGKAADACTQMTYAAISYYLHAAPVGDISEKVEELQASFSIFDVLPDTHMHASFGHLDGYSSVYYTYMWSLVIAKDLFAAFDSNDLYASEVAARYRYRILAGGGAKDAADLVKDFLGRPYDFSAFAQWLARESTPTTERSA